MNKLEPAGMEAAVAEIKASFYEADQDDVTVAERIVRAYLSALDVPAHPEGVKASAEHGPETEAVLRRDGFFLTIEWWRLGTKLTARVYEPQGLPISAALADLLALALEERPKLAASALSHPEPVAQEAVSPLEEKHEDGRRKGHSKLVYDKASRTIVSVDPHPASLARTPIPVETVGYLADESVKSLIERLPEIAKAIDDLGWHDSAHRVATAAHVIAAFCEKTKERKS